MDSGGTQGLSVDENVKMFAKTKNNVTASVDLTWGINKELPYFISIYGTNGTCTLAGANRNTSSTRTRIGPFLAKAMTRSRRSKARSKILQTPFAARKICTSNRPKTLWHQSA